MSDNELVWPLVNNINDIVLASASPRRVDILNQIGLKFRQIPSNINEDLGQDMSPADLVKKLAHNKALDIAEKESNALVIGCDTIVAFNNDILGKPGNSTKAFEMLSMLNGKMHQVYSGISVFYKKKLVSSDVEITNVYFNKVDESELLWYSNTKEPLDKAGAYAIQGLGAMLVKKIDGCFYNVVGFPLSKFTKILGEVNK